MFSANTRILIVDDMFTMRKIVRKVCKDLGFTEFADAADGQEAWNLLTTSEIPFQLVISDWNMPNCTGIDLLKKVRGDQNLKNLPFLLLTAESEQHQVLEALKSGVDNYILKPFTPASFKVKLEDTYKKVSTRTAA